MDMDAWVRDWVPSKHANFTVHPMAMTHARFLARWYQERFWVTRNGEGGWYVAPASERPSPTEGS